MNEYMTVLKKWNVFTGRAGRREYWMFVLINLIIAIGLQVVGMIIHTNFLYALYNLFILVPAIAAGIRRMHDTDHVGWWILAPFINLFFAIIDGTPGPNRFGEDPKSRTAAQGFAVVQP